jgi:hypothetical protein
MGRGEGSHKCCGTVFISPTDDFVLIFI